MTIRIRANRAAFANDGYSTSLGFAQDPMSPRLYVMLSLTNSPDEQDSSLGMDGVHIEAGDLKVDGYDLVAGLALNGRDLTIRIEPEAARKANIGSEIEIAVDTDSIDEVALNEIVRIFQARIAGRYGGRA